MSVKLMQGIMPERKLNVLQLRKKLGLIFSKVHLLKM